MRIRPALGLCLLAIALGAIMTPVSQFLLWLIGGITSVAFHGRIDPFAPTPLGNHLGLWVIAVPVLGGVIVGLMARFGSPAIRGHGIPEAMEQVLENASRIPARVVWLKPLSAAISIGTGGPFGAEGPIIATGGAGGSLLGQLIPTSPSDRKILLAAGAAAGMAATFGSPLSALLLAIELLLFEFNARSIIPVALAVSVAVALRAAWVGTIPVFDFAHSIRPPSIPAFFGLMIIAALLGVLAVWISRAVYLVEDLFEKLPVHWMWWPAIGGIAVGVAGWIEPRTLGVGYGNITANLACALPLGVALAVCGLKFLSWSIALGSGTSGGTLAPLLTIGSGLGLAGGIALHPFIPSLDPHLAALIGMACIFGGASRAMLASVVFAYETTGQGTAIFPLLACVGVTLLVVRAMGSTSIMTEKITRRGIHVPSHLAADIFEHTSVSRVMETEVTMVQPTMSLDAFAGMFSRPCSEGSPPHAFPVVDESGRLVGLVTRGDLVRSLERVEAGGTVADIMSSAPITITPAATLHAAIQKMLAHDVGRMPVVSPEDPFKVIGFLSRRAILSARRRLLDEEVPEEPSVAISLRAAARK
ncbi:MAG TPA: chloride channel protein [Chthoniobacterales bacterium]